MTFDGRYALLWLRPSLGGVITSNLRSTGCGARGFHARDCFQDLWGLVWVSNLVARLSLASSALIELIALIVRHIPALRRHFVN